MAPFIVLLALIAVMLGVAVRDEIKFKGNVPANYRFGFFFVGTVIACILSLVSIIIGPGVG